MNKTSTNDSLGFVAAALDRTQDEPAWLQAFRTDAQQRWQKMSPPTLRSEAYRYTNLKPLLAEKFSLVTTTNTVLASNYATLQHKDEYCYVFVDGKLSHSPYAPLPQGVQCLSLRQAITTGAVTAEQLYLTASNDYLQLLNDICFDDGIYVHVAAGVKLDRPLHLIFVNSERAAGKAMFSRNVLVVAEGAKLPLIESHYGLTTASYLSIVRTTVEVGTEANCALVKFQHEGKGAYHCSAVAGQQQQNSRLGLLNISYGGRLARLDNRIAQLARGAHCDFRSLYLGKDRQVLDNCSHITHHDVEGTTRQQVRGIVRDQARGIFAGSIIVPRQAQRTDAEQLTKNLLFGKDCAVYIKPQLQIEADDVQCSHGATSSRIAATDLYYLAARGIDRAAAAQLLCRAHVSELTQNLPIPSTQRFFDQVLADFLL